MTPLRRQSVIKQAWRVGYPVGIHFLIGQSVAAVGLRIIMDVYKLPKEAYVNYVILLTGITAVISMIPSIFLYRRDKTRRIFGGIIHPEEGVRLRGKELLLLLIIGAGLAQYGNVIVNVLQIFLKSTEYQDTMKRISGGKGFAELVFWMGIMAPAAEEMIFRWLVYLRLRDYMKRMAAAVLSGVLFGVYHGNIVQAIYASMLGILFAYILEVSGNIWSSVLLHIGANVWSLFISQYGLNILEMKYGEMFLLIAYMMLLIAMIVGIYYFAKKGKKRTGRCF